MRFNFSRSADYPRPRPQVKKKRRNRHSPKAHSFTFAFKVHLKKLNPLQVGKTSGLVVVLRERIASDSPNN